MKTFFALFILLVLVIPTFAQDKLYESLEVEAEKMESEMIEWRRHFHENPELSNREFKTSEYIADLLRKWGYEVQTGIAHTGVVGVLKGGKPGPVIGIRADMDALPVTERVDLPFASKVFSEYNGEKTGVMHACGHDTHMAIQLAVAKIYSENKKNIRGTLKFVFQPAEEGKPPGEEGGAKLMVKEGVMKNPDIDAIFGLHISSDVPVGVIQYKPEGIMAAVDRFVIKVKGVQTHGADPWDGVDPIVTSALIINGLQTIVSRQSKLIEAPAVVTVGRINGGIRYNIIPEECTLIGTIRTLDSDMQEDIHKKLINTATKIAESQGATAEVEIEKIVPVTYNDIELTAFSAKSLSKIIEPNKLEVIKPVTGGEDFSEFQKVAPGFFFFVGGLPANHKEGDYIPSHHTPDFYVDESGLLTGLKAMLRLTTDYMYK